MKNAKDIRRYRDNRQGEIDAANLYRTMAAIEKQPQLAEIYRRMAEVEERHVAFWEDQIRAAGAPLSPRRPSWRSRTYSFLARKVGSSFILPTISATENSASQSYAGQPEVSGGSMAADERSHGRMLSLISGQGDQGMAGSSLVRLEGRHRTIGGNALRAAVLGVNDGLCSDLSLVMAVAGAHMASRNILITGIAGLLAGASSMAMGEWLSVQSSRELYQHEMATEAEELATAPEEEMAELALIYQSKGMGAEDARRMAETLIADPRQALDTLAREELGIDPGVLGGSAWEAAGMSFLLFTVGAIFPLAPFIFLRGNLAIVTSLVVSTLALFGSGAGISLITGRGVLYSGFRQILFGLSAAGITYAIGRLIGVSIAG